MIKVKKNKFNKLAILFLTIIMLFAFVLCGAQYKKAKAAETGVIQLSIYSMHGDSGLGHAWIVVENGTKAHLNFYNTVMVGYETYSIGTWGTLKDPLTDELFKGAWLCYEAYRNYGIYNTASLTITITPEQLTTVSDKCIELNYWSAIKNCAYFAAKVWNTVAPSDMQVKSGVLGIHTPSKLKSSIMSIEGYQINRAFKYNDYAGYCTSPTKFKYILASRIIDNGSSSSSSNALNYDITSFPKEFDTVEKIQNAYDLMEASHVV